MLASLASCQPAFPAAPLAISSGTLCRDGKCVLPALALSDSGSTIPIDLQAAIQATEADRRLMQADTATVTAATKSLTGRQRRPRDPHALNSQKQTTLGGALELGTLRPTQPHARPRAALPPRDASVASGQRRSRSA